VSEINSADAKDLYERLLAQAKKKTAEADVVLGEDGKPIEEAEENYGGSVLIVDRAGQAMNVPHAESVETTEAAEPAEAKKKRKSKK